MRLPNVCMAVLLVVRGASAEDPPPPPAAEKAGLEEVIVVTASRTEQRVEDAPVAVSVITATELAERPGDGYAEILRNVPGLNVTQIDAREIQVMARGAASSLATGQLVLLDGRSLYLDFFGFVMWDFLPVDVSEIKQIEVVRGPGSAVWGANAMNGVINLITRRPDEMKGTSVVIGAGERGTLLGSFVHAAARDGAGTSQFAYKVSASSYREDPLDRPTGFVPGTGTPYPAFENEGTQQSRADVRLDRTGCAEGCASASLSAGYSGTDGLVHTGIGPFAVRRGSALTYAKGDLSTGNALHASVFANLLDADSTNLLAVGVDGRPIGFSFDTGTFGADVTSTTLARRKHVLTYGLSVRHSEFDLSIARGETRRNEGGVFLQDEVAFGRTRWVIGARVDDREPIGVVVSPRLAFLYSTAPGRTLRLSFGRAYRAPSVVNNALSTAILSSVPLPGARFAFATRAFGNPGLREERMDAWDLGYAGSLRRNVSVFGCVYRNRSSDVIDFYPEEFYTAAHPPQDWPLPPQLLDSAPFLGALPAAFSYRNVGEVVNRGVEIGASARPSSRWSWFANYSWQDTPQVRGIPAGEVNAPPSHRLNAGSSWNVGRFFVNATVNYQSEAVWRDILDARYWGPTAAFTSWNASSGVHLNEKTTFTVTATNLANARIQQHVFGDIIGRRVTAQLRFAGF